MEMSMTTIWTIAVLIISVLLLAIPFLLWKREHTIRKLIDAGKFTFTLLWRQRGNTLEPGYYLFYGSVFIGHFPTFEKLSNAKEKKHGYFIGRVPASGRIATMVSGNYLALQRREGAGQQ